MTSDSSLPDPTMALSLTSLMVSVDVKHRERRKLEIDLRNKLSHGKTDPVSRLGIAVRLCLQLTAFSMCLIINSSVTERTSH